MADLKHTPGPWHIQNCPCGHPKCERKQLSNVGTFYVGSGFDEPDARLIAAAPELYGLLTAIDDMWSDDGDGGRADPIDARSGKVREIWTDIRAALAKARGESA